MGFGSLRVPQQPNQLRVHFRRVRSQPPALSTAILVCLQLVPLPGLTCSLFVHSSVHCLPLVLFGVCYRRVVFPTSRVENTPYTVRGSYHPSPVSPIPFLHSPSPWGRFPLLNSSLVCEGAFVRTSALRVHYPGALLSRSFPRLLHRRSDDESQPKPHRSSPHHHQHRHPSHSSSLLIPRRRRPSTLFLLLSLFHLRVALFTDHTSHEPRFLTIPNHFSQQQTHHFSQQTHHLR